MRFSSVVSTVFGLCIGTSLASTQQSNLTTPQLTQRILTGDFKPAQVFENTNVVRTINLEKGYVRETTNVVITNTDNQAQTEYYVPFEYDVVGRIGGFDVRDKKHAERGPLDVTVAALADVLEDAQGGFSPKYVCYQKSYLDSRLTREGRRNITLSTSLNRYRQKAPSHSPSRTTFSELYDRSQQPSNKRKSSI